MIELFTNGNEQYFASTLGIHSLRAHFIQLEKRILGPKVSGATLELEFGPEILEAEKTLRSDLVFGSLVV